MSTVAELKESVRDAREEFTRASAIMGEVQESISREIEKLKELGVKVPEKDNEEVGYTPEYLDKVSDSVAEFLEKLEDDVDNKKAEIAGIIQKWEV